MSESEPKSILRTHDYRATLTFASAPFFWSYDGHECPSYIRIDVPTSLITVRNLVGRTRPKLLPTILSAVCGCVLMTSMVSIVLTDTRLSDGFWPRDIGEEVVKAFGGTTDFRSGGAPQIELSWLSVMGRLAAMLISSAAVAVLWTQLRSANHAAPRTSQQILSAFQTAITAISRPWLNRLPGQSF